MCCRPLLETSDLTALAALLWQAPLAVAVSTDASVLTPDTCMYANQAALTAMNFSWEDLAGPAAARVAAQHQEVSMCMAILQCYGRSRQGLTMD